MAKTEHVKATKANNGRAAPPPLKSVH